VKPTGEQPKLGGSLGGLATLGTKTSSLSGNLGGTSSPGTTSSPTVSGSTTTGTTSAIASAAGLGSSSSGTVIRSQLPKDQPLPQPLAEAFENFK